MASLVVVWSAAARASTASPAPGESGSASYALATTDTGRATADALGERFLSRERRDTGCGLAWRVSYTRDGVDPENQSYPEGRT